jgi:hypothetical protein
MEPWVEKTERLQNSPRLRALEERLARLGAADSQSNRRTARALRLILIDAVLEGDIFTLEAAVDGLRDVEQSAKRTASEPADWELVGHIDGLREHALLALERVPPLSQLAAYEPEGQAASFLRLVAEGPGIDNLGVAGGLGDVAPERVSVLGRDLERRGLVRKRRVGRRNSWDITPRGVQTLQLIDAGGSHRSQREHRLPAMG